MIGPKHQEREREREHEQQTCFLEKENKDRGGRRLVESMYIIYLRSKENSRLNKETT